jgi:LmbE family N-acetylglucosaminyl deacetylase
MRSRLTLPSIAALALLAAQLVPAQLRVRPVDLEDGAVALGLVLRQLGTTAVFMQATAHPDDENNALHVYLRRGRGARTILATATRGDGGQNEIGREIFDALAVLRTEELNAMHRFDASEQYFTRAVDFGYSFSIEETLERWGRDEIIGDYVRLIRMTRPDVIVGMSPIGTAGGLHHQASGILSREAFKAAGDPSRYPEQIKEGLRPWHARKYYYPLGGIGAGRGGATAPAGTPPLAGLRTAVFDISSFDPLLGRTYPEVGSEERSMHKSQAMAQLLALPNTAAVQRYLLMDSSVAGAGAEEASLFDGIDTTLPGLVGFVQGSPPPALLNGLRSIAGHVSAAQKGFDLDDPFSIAQPLIEGLSAVRALRQQLSGLGLSEDAVYNIDARLKTKEDEFVQAAVLAHGVRVEALADDGIVVPAQNVRVSLIVADRGPHVVSVRSVSLNGFEGKPACSPSPLQTGGVYRCDASMRVSPDAKTTRPYWKTLPDAARYEFESDAPFGLPFRPTPFRALVAMTLSGASVSLELPVQFRYAGSQLEGEKRMELTVVPKLALRVMPDIAIVPGGRGATSAVDREVRVTLTNHDKGATAGQVRMDLPAGWGAVPATSPVNFTREDEVQTIRFTVRPGAAAALGQYPIKISATVGTQAFEHGYQIVEYPHIQRRQLEIRATTAFKVMDVRLAPNLTVGYIMGTGDDVPTALRGLGATVQMLDTDALAWGDLSRFDAIVVGVRAYDSREDLRANNKRLLEYAESGGILIVQYNRESDWIQYAPYPARATSTRVTDENGKIQILASDDPVFHYPNEIADSVWRGWVQERGTYFIDGQDQRYADLIQVYEPFEHNQGWKTGALVDAPVGKGRWIYVGLGLWRQVAAGTDGAYQLFANLISRGKLPGTKR